MEHINPTIESKFYIMTSADKASGFIAISYTGSPEIYIEGGTLKYHMADKNGIRDYEFKATRSSAYYEFYKDTYFYAARRTMILNALMNALIVPHDSSSTEVRVNAKYMMTQQLVAETMGGIPIESTRETITFQTGEVTRGSITNTNIFYFSNGVFEKTILDFVRK